MKLRSDKKREDDVEGVMVVMSKRKKEIGETVEALSSSYTVKVG